MGRYYEGGTFFYNAYGMGMKGGEGADSACVRLNFHVERGPQGANSSAVQMLEREGNN